MDEIRVSEDCTAQKARFLTVTGRGTDFTPWTIRVALEARFGPALRLSCEFDSLRVYCPRTSEWQEFVKEVEVVLRENLGSNTIVWDVAAEAT